LQILNAWIKHIILIILFATFLELLLPNNNYKKFVKVIMGLLVLQAVLQPVIDVVHHLGREAKVTEVASYTIIDKPLEMTNQTAKLQTERDRLALEQYRQELTKQVQVLAGSVAGVGDVSASISLNEQKHEKGYGVIKTVTISAKADQTVKAPTNIEHIKQVEVGEVSRKTAVVPVLPDHVKAQLKKVITDFYHLSADQVIIVDG
jgi:stage III sporulation protein AF